MNEQENDQTGVPIERFDSPRDDYFEYVIGNEQYIEAITSHISEHIGEVEFVDHEIISTAVHIDIHWVKPNSNFPFYTLVTSGMSDKPMTVPEGCEDSQYAELCILLPPD